ncbi:MAG: YciI family protein [Gemmataceae bacterium]|nr:YciI family protein [Gemmataceae bacterium]
MRILGLLKADESSERGDPPSPELMEKMGKFIEEVAKAGVLLATDGLLPSSKGKRVRVVGGKITVIDGPFTESKELIASYALLQVKTMDEAVEWTSRFLKALGGGECELRPIFEAGEGC